MSLRAKLILALLTCCETLPAQIPAASRALLIGIGAYEHSALDVQIPAGAVRAGRYQPAITFENLLGPRNDVTAIKSLLTSKFRIPDDEKHIHVLLDQAATRKGILQAMEQYLVQEPNPGDTVVLYLSSHGSVRPDPSGRGQQYDLDGTGRHPTYLENTIVPYDWYLGVDDIFSRDLRHIFNLAADRGIHLTAIFDSCHSGFLGRSAMRPELISREFAFDPRLMPPDPYPSEAAGPPPESRPENPVLVLSAAQKDQLAFENKDAKPPHGIFTAALIDCLQSLPGDRSADEVFRRLQIAIELSPGSANQQPLLDAPSGRRALPLFGGEAGHHPATATVISADPSGALLDAGFASNIGPGSEFSGTTTDGVRVVLTVRNRIGLARSLASISPPGVQLKPKDTFELTKWVAAQEPVLNFYAGSSPPTGAAITEASNSFVASGHKLVADPSSEPWDCRVYWDGVRWLLRERASQKPVVLGAKISNAALKRVPPANALWFDAPLPRESFQAMFLPVPAGTPQRAAVLISDRSQANYVIAGAATGAGIRYAWFKLVDLDAGVRTPAGMGPGCSPDSPFPMRTDWVSDAQQGKRLTDSAVQLARLNAWLQLGSSLTGQMDFGYQLVLRGPNEEDVLNGGQTSKGIYEMDLIAQVQASIPPRWAYILNIDCQGTATLEWPNRNMVASPIPTDKGRLDRIPLGRVELSAPFGVDTYLFLTTSNPLADPWALEFSAVVTRSAKLDPEKLNPLEQLLDSASAGTRADGKPTPADWSVQTLRTHSSGQPAAKAVTDK